MASVCPNQSSVEFIMTMPYSGFLEWGPLRSKTAKCYCKEPLGHYLASRNSFSALRFAEVVFARLQN